MGPRIVLALRLLVALAVASTVVLLAEPVTALTVPETLAQRRPVQAGPVETAFPIDSVGVLWDTDDGHGHDDHGHEAGAHGAIRFRHDGAWGPWIDLEEDGAESEGQWASGLVEGDDAEAYQVRGIPASARSPRAVAINTTDGPPVKVGERRGGGAGALPSSMCQSRADWGADESLRFKDGTESWVPTYHPVQVLSVHHTATANGETGTAAEARLRSIYRYHAIDRNFGDIGYQYLIDAAGVVYEGRWSGEASRSCEGTSGGDGSDFGHATGSDHMVNGAHVGGANSGNLGAALLGTFSTTDPSVPAVDGLEALLAELSTRHGLDPQGTTTYVNPVNGSTKTVATISAHRDWAATECPGERLYAQLPAIRAAVAAAMAPPATSPDHALSVTSMAPQTLKPGRTTVTVAGTGFTNGAVVSFVNGKGGAPTAGASTVAGDGRSLSTLVSVPSKGAKGWWDVVVTLTDGRRATCVRCAYVER